MVTFMHFEIDATDGYKLACTLYPCENLRQARVVLAGATGVPQRFYRRFAEHLARAGFEVVTFDYRGIGASRRAPLKGFDANFLTWPEKDLEAVVNWSLESAKTAVVGHSFGGHAFGMLSRANDTLGLFVFGVGAGWDGYMRPLERARVKLFWNVLGPLSTRMLGFMPGSKFGMGEDLPLGVYTQWKRWCRYPTYFFEDRTLDMTSRFGAVHVPVVAVNVEDDAWAPPQSGRAFVSGYANAPLDCRSIAAVSPMGHMGYFRPGPAQTVLWDDARAWLEQRAA